MTEAKIQHYVPRFLLRNFGLGKKDHVWVYDKTTGRSFRTNAKNIAAESHFYDFEHNGQPATLETSLAKLESATKPVIEALLKADSLMVLPDDQRLVVAAFLSVQLTRTKAFRAQWEDFPRLLREHLANAGDEVAPDSQAAELVLDLTQNEAKAQTAKFIMSSPRYFGPHLASKVWVLLSTSPKHPFMISDNPVAKQNLIDRPHRGNLGLTVPGIEIYLPLSPTRALAMWCPTLVEAVRRNADEVRRSPGPLTDRVAAILAVTRALDNGSPLHYAPENAENFNSLQIGWSERYVFSSVDDFRLVEDMLHNEPALRRGPRMKTA
jgi:hypothetical protein